MKDLIERQAAIDALMENVYLVDGYYCEMIEVIDKDDAIKTIMTLPSKQPEIVRCKDCKWKQGSECVRFAEVRPFPDDFCSRAERRTDEPDK